MPETPDQTPDFPTHFDFTTAEPALTRAWDENGIFRANADRSTRLGGDRAPFTVLIPPPNVTAVLHVGHGLNNTVQDVLVRWRRMAGDEALWLPGTDHAGIATQNVVEKIIAKEGKTRFDLGREAFVKRTEQFVEETGGVILQQLKAIGASADFSRTAYTLTPELSRAVREAFVRLWEKDLVYRGHRVIHWCPRCLTSLSDEEAEFHDSEGALHHVRYALADDPAQGITIATTRPETILADVAIAVHPDDERYAALVGKQVLLPLTGITMPVIADEYVEKDFGSGALKITPAHDANDFEVGKRHNLAMPVVIDPSGKMGEVVNAEGRVPAEFAGLDRFDARKKIVKALEASGALVKIEKHANAIRRCYRCDTVVEPRLSDQWFVRMAPLAAPALAAVKDGTVRLLPEKWEKVYINWLDGIRDWNISRQLWWGHRVPVFTCEQGHALAYREDPPTCAHTAAGRSPCGAKIVAQDPDVLDTWFSSWLWPISTMGWPNENAKDLKAFFPSDVLVTAPEILFFWVARMIMSGFEFLGRTPFHTVYLHGTVRDMQHRKMSKSLGNGIDPLDVVERYGADALRWTLIQGMGLGVDVMLDPNDLDKSFAPGRNFATKLWNIGRFLLIQVGDEPIGRFDDIDAAALRLEDRWILGRLDAAIAECDAALGPARPASAQWPENQRQSGMRLDAYAEAARRFVWNELADWYVEAVKPRLAQPGADRETARRVLVHVFDHGLRLLHPIMPFVTESLWQRLPAQTPGQFLAVAPWPVQRAAGADAGVAFDAVREAIDAIRGLRAEYGVQPGAPIKAFVARGAATAAERDALIASQALVTRLARCELSTDAAPSGAAAHAVLASKLELSLPLAGMVDLGKEKARLSAEVENLSKQLSALRGRLRNETFTAKAPPAVVAAERAKEQEWAARVAQMQQKIQELGA